MLRHLLIGLTSAFLFQACAKKPESPTVTPAPLPQRQQNHPQKGACFPEKNLVSPSIVGGKRVQENDADAKRVMILYTENAKKEGQLCTATAIHPRVLLTAAHCVNGLAQRSWVGLHHSVSCESGFDTRNNTIQIKEFIPHPGYQPQNREQSYNSNDIALVVLAEDLPRSYSIHKIADPTQITSGSKLYFLGYGDIGYRKGGAGILRRTLLPSTSYQIMYDYNKVAVNQTGGSGICQGDSGGPGFVHSLGELQILGVNSYVAGTFSVNCHEFSVMTLAHPYQDWIKTHLQERSILFE